MVCRVGEREGFRDYAGRVALIEGERGLESKRDAWIAETSESVLLCRALQTRARSSPSAFLSKLVLAMVPCSSRTSPEREAGRRGGGSGETHDFVPGLPCYVFFGDLVETVLVEVLISLQLGDA